MENAKMWGYARVSSTSQNLDRQVTALSEYGIEERQILQEQQSGKDFNRPVFMSLVGTERTAPLLRAGDCLVVVSLDRLGRNYEEIRRWWQYITTELQCDIVILDMPLLDTRCADGNLDKRFVADLVLQILSYVSEKERLSIRERQRQGIDAAKARGVKLGRKRIPKPEGFSEVCALWREQQITAVEAMRRLGITKHTFYRLVKEEL